MTRSLLFSASEKRWYCADVGSPFLRPSMCRPRRDALGWKLALESGEACCRKKTKDSYLQDSKFWAAKNIFHQNRYWIRHFLRSKDLNASSRCDVYSVLERHHERPQTWQVQILIQVCPQTDIIWRPEMAVSFSIGVSQRLHIQSLVWDGTVKRPSFVSGCPWVSLSLWNCQMCPQLSG